MKHSEKLLKLADRFEQKIKKQAQETTQFGTTELFFTNEATQLEFVKGIGNVQVKGDKLEGTGPVAKILADYRNKTQNPASFSMDVTAEPKKGAFFTIKVDPPALKQSVVSALSNLYNAVVKKNMVEVQKNADQKAKEGYGSGTNHVQDFDVA